MLRILHLNQFKHWSVIFCIVNIITICIVKIVHNQNTTMWDMARYQDYFNKYSFKIHVYNLFLSKIGNKIRSYIKK